MKDFAGKNAVITGGAAGMGRATALAFANEGAAVAILDIQRDAGEEVVRLIRESGGTAEFIEADVSDARQVDGAFDRVAKTVGPYDILFNHAGTITVKLLHESTEADYDRLMDINVRSAFLVCRRAVKEMSDNGGGSIVITASIASELGYALESLYCMTKGAVLQLARSISGIPGPGDSLQRRVPRLRQDCARPARDRGAGRRGTGLGGRRARRSPGPHLQARRGCRCSRVPGLRRGQLHHRQRPIRR